MGGLIQIAWRAVCARPVRSTLTALAVALGICVVLGVEISTAGLNAQAVAAANLSAGDSNLDVRVATGTGLTAAQASELGQVRGVAQAAPLYEKRDVAYTSVHDSTGTVVTLIGISHGGAALRPVLLQSGRLPAASAPHQVAIDASLAAQLSQSTGTPVHVGSTILLTTDNAPDAFTVVGLTDGTSAGSTFTDAAVFVDQTTLTASFSDGLRIPLVALRLDPTASQTAVAALIRQSLGTSVSVVDPESTAGPLNQLVPLLVLLTVLSVAIGAGVTANSVSLSVSERRRETSLLRAAGASGNQVFRLFVYEAGIEALLGAPLGLVAGVGMGWLLTAELASPTLPSPPVYLDGPSILVALVIGVAAGVLGATIPASIASHSPILDGLRLHAGAREKTTWRVVMLAPVLAVLGVLCFLGGGSAAGAFGAALLLAAMAALLPAIIPLVVHLLAAVLSPLVPQADVAEANLLRRRNRTAMTSAGLSLAVAAAVATSALAAGATGASNQWISHLFVGNEVVKSSVPQSDQVAEMVADDLKHDATDPVAGHPLAGHVSSVIAVRVIPAAVSGDVLGVAVLPFSAPPANTGKADYLNSYPSTGGLDFITPSRQAAIQAVTTSDSVLAPQSLADAEGWSVGTTISIEGANNKLETFRIAGIVAHSFPSGDGRECLIMDTAVADTTFGTVDDLTGAGSTYVASGFDFLDVSSDGDNAAVAAIASRYGLQTTPLSTIEASATGALNNSIGLLEAIAIVSVLVAMLSVVNTMIVNVRTGTRDLALLRAVGLSRRDATRLVLCESGVLVVSATLIGTAGGALLTIPMLMVSSSVGFSPVYNFPVITAAVLIVTVVIAALGATAVPARNASRTSIVSSIRYE